MEMNVLCNLKLLSPDKTEIDYESYESINVFFKMKKSLIWFDGNATFPQCTGSRSCEVAFIKITVEGGKSFIVPLDSSMIIASGISPNFNGILCEV